MSLAQKPLLYPLLLTTQLVKRSIERQQQRNKTKENELPSTTTTTRRSYLPPTDTLNPILATQEITPKYTIKPETHKTNMTTDFDTQQHKMKCPDNTQHVVSSQNLPIQTFPRSCDREKCKGKVDRKSEKKEMKSINVRL